MTNNPPDELWNAYLATLVELGATDPHVVVVEPSRAVAISTTAVEHAFLGRLTRVDDPSPDAFIQSAASLAASGRTVFASTRASVVVQGYGTVRQLVAYARANVKLVARFPWPSPTSEEGSAPPVEDIGLMRGAPGMTVVVPADAPTTRSVIRAITSFEGPAYIRLAEGEHPTLTDGSFALGRANILREGSDLTMVAAGPIVGAVLALAEEFREVGVSVRVLDCVSIKPIDAPALLRAARDTGAILVAEEHTVETGLGELVAATVAENFAVPVRRIAVPDLFEVPPGPHGKLGPAADRLRDEAWELLRLRGKVQ